MKLNQLRLLLTALCLMLAVPGCGKKEGEIPGGGAPKKKLKLAFVTNNASSFWTIARAGTADAVTAEHQSADETPAQAAVSPAGCVIEYVTDPHPSPSIRGAVKVDAKVQCGRPVPEQDLSLMLLADGKPVFKTVAMASNKAALFNQSTYIRCKNSSDRHTFQGAATSTSVEGGKPYVRSKASRSVVLPCGY